MYLRKILKMAYLEFFKNFSTRVFMIISFRCELCILILRETFSYVIPRPNSKISNFEKIMNSMHNHECDQIRRN